MRSFYKKIKMFLHWSSTSKGKYQMALLYPFIIIILSVEFYFERIRL